MKLAILLATLLAWNVDEAFASLPSGRYVDPSVCTPCHAAITARYARTAMARSFGTVPAATNFDGLEGGSFGHPASREFPYSGFGYINSTSLYSQPRNGQLVARFTF